MLLRSVLGGHRARSDEHAVVTTEESMHIEPSDPMACVEDINEHCRWFEHWTLGGESR